MNPILTPRQREIASLLITGLSNREIATRCGIGLQSVKNQAQIIYRLHSVHSRWELARTMAETSDDMEALKVENHRLLKKIESLERANRVLRRML